MAKAVNVCQLKKMLENVRDDCDVAYMDDMQYSEALKSGRE